MQVPKQVTGKMFLSQNITMSSTEPQALMSVFYHFSTVISGNKCTGKYRLEMKNVCTSNMIKSISVN